MSLLECANNHQFNGDRYGNICPRCGLTVADADKDGKLKTEEQIAAELNVPAEKRVCGWLVCVEGINKGRAYQIHPGKNFIGSRDDMDIQIRGDRQISEVRHAVVVYDAKKQETLLLPGESRGLVYLEDEAVYERQELEPYNNIEIGQTKLMFVPFCSSQFSWEKISE